MAQGKHIGKVVVAFPEAVRCRGAANRPRRPSQSSRTAAILITGAFGGFGKVLAAGSSNAAPGTSSSPAAAAPSTPEAEAFVEDLHEPRRRRAGRQGGRRLA